MRAKIRWALVGVIGLALVVGLACKKFSSAAKVSVPAGEFAMGMSPDDGFQECQNFYGDQHEREFFENEEPVHKVYLDAYYIDKYEVTQEDYDKCVAAGKCRDNFKNDGCTGLRQSVVGVRWVDARNYCSWVGKRLPTEAEWEKAARGADGRMYPWGNEFDGNKANFCDKNCENDWKLMDWDDGYAKTAPVGSYPQGASPYGALDMAGNVWEWVADWYQPDYYGQSRKRNPRGPDTGSHRVLRGGGWNSFTGTLGVAYRFAGDPMDQGSHVGFRCAGD